MFKIPTSGRRSIPETTGVVTRTGINGMADRKPKRRRGILTAVAAALAAAITLAPFQATSALAYDRGSCPATERIGHDLVQRSAGSVDFGDDAHLFGAPQGTAVVCWYTGRSKVIVIGKLYNDGLNGTVRTVMDFFLTNGKSYQRIFTETGSGGLEANPIYTTLANSAATPVSGNLDYVRIKLQIPQNGGWTTVDTSRAYY